MEFNKEYWAKRYIDKSTGWDLGEVSPPIKSYIDKLKIKKLNVLIPGSGNSYEAEYLFSNDFSNISVVDIANEPLQNIKKRVVDFPDKQLIQSDFFKFKPEKSFDLIIEQTFFCAIDVDLRHEYVIQCYNLLKAGGKLIGLLFDDLLYKDHPPFGGNKTEYLNLFEPYFNVLVLENCNNSHSSRSGKELWFEFTKKSFNK